MDFINKIFYIYRLIVTTPHFFILAILNLLSVTFTFVGLPLLIPALNYLQPENNQQNQNIYFENIEKALQYINIVPSFLSFVILATLFIFFGQILLLIIELFQKHVNLKLQSHYMKELIINYYKVNWQWMTDDRSGNFHSAVSREAKQASAAHQNSHHFQANSIIIF